MKDLQGKLASSEGKASGDVARLFGAVVVGPPRPPGFEVPAKGRASNRMQHRVDQVLRRDVEGIIIEEIKQLRHSREPLFPGQHSRPREIARGALADFWRRVVGQDGEKRIDGFIGAEHRQSFDRPEARLLT